MSLKDKRAALRRTLIIIILIISVAALIMYNSPLSSLFNESVILSPVTSSDVVSYSDTVSSGDLVTEPQEPDTATLMFGGDILIHKSVYSRAKTGSNTYNFMPFVELFQDVFVADYNAVNLESPVDAYGGNKSIQTYPKFNAPLELLDALKSMNIDLCSNSNNHMIDCGFDGLLATIKNLDAYGFDHLGTYASQEEHDTPFIRDINGIKVGFLAYTQWTNGLKLSAELEEYAFDRMGTKPSSVEKLLPQVDALRASGAEIIVAILHWGTEYNNYPSYAQENIAHALCEGGVDIIMGSHPHVVQPIEKLTFTNEDGTTRDCLVVYSLGNLLCNQSSQTEYTQRGMVVAVKFERGEDGIARFVDSFYMPTLLHVTWKDGTDFLRLVPAGRYMDSDNIPAPLSSTDVFRDRCRTTWNSVVSIVGDDIPVVTDPDNYPEGFFSSSEE